MKLKKKSMVVLERYIRENMRAALPLVKVHLMLTKENLTASDIWRRLGIKRRQLYYMSENPLIRIIHGKSKWKRYSIIDLLALSFYLNMSRRLGTLAGGVLFRWLRKLLNDNLEFLVHLAVGREIVLLFDYKNFIHSHLFVLPDQEELLNKLIRKRVSERIEPLTLFPLSNFLRETLMKIAVSDFSTDVGDQNRITFKIAGRKIVIECIPRSVLSKALKRDDLNRSSWDILNKILSHYRKAMKKRFPDKFLLW